MNKNCGFYTQNNFFFAEKYMKSTKKQKLQDFWRPKKEQ